jgi:hypothetical protein
VERNESAENVSEVLAGLNPAGEVSALQETIQPQMEGVMNDKIVGRPVRLNKRILQLKDGKDYTEVVFLGDVHYGNKACAIQKFLDSAGFIAIVDIAEKNYFRVIFPVFQLQNPFVKPNWTTNNFIVHHSLHLRLNSFL